MMLVISSNDMRKLSPACRLELMAVFMSAGADEPLIDDHLPPGIFEADNGQEDAVRTAAEEVHEEKRVVDLTVDEARDLLANISKRSHATLALFASGQPVALAALIGPSCEYRDYSELKRSFVGAVNRRLRTVSGNRNAALFSSDRDKTRIKITKKTALALRCLFDMPEPLPDFDFIDRSGNAIDSADQQCQILKLRLASAWQDFSGRPNDVSAEPWHARVLAHFASAGLELLIRTPAGLDNETFVQKYEIHTVADPFIVIHNAIEDSNPDTLDGLCFGLGSEAQVMACPVL
jgi:hypothetical protein